MDSESRQSDIAFSELACRLGFLDSKQAEQLMERVESSGRSIREVILRRGQLTVQQLDILETLLAHREVVPGYEIQEVIGRGGMGIVYRARQITLDRTVAIKTVLINQLQKANATQRFEQEAVSIARLSHPHIVTAYDFGHHDGRLFLVMELVPGLTLQSLLDCWNSKSSTFENDDTPTVDSILTTSNEGQFVEPTKNFEPTFSINTEWPESQELVRELASIKNDPLQRSIFMLGIARQVASGLAHAQKIGIVHRDIKPANLLLQEKPHGLHLPGNPPMVKIMDFGLALLSNHVELSDQSRITKEGATVGSPHYMAPEQLSGEPVDHRADIYSLGATLFHILKGQAPGSDLPFGQLIADKSMRIPFDAYRDLPDIPEAIRKWLPSLMQPNPANRVSDYREILVQVDYLLDLLSGHSRSPFYATSRPAIRSRVSDPRRELESLYDQIPSETLSSAASESAAQKKKQITRRRMMIGGAVALGTAAIATTTLPLLLRKPAQVGQWKPLLRGEHRNLYNGEGLDGWDVSARSVGKWRTLDAPDGSRAITCTSSRGAMSRAVPDWPDISIAASMWLGVADSIEIQFGLQQSNSAADRWSLRLSKLGFDVGQRSGDFGTWRKMTEPLLPQVDFDRYLAVTLERQFSNWYVFVEGKLMAQFPAAAHESDEIRVASQGNGGFKPAPKSEQSSTEDETNVPKTGWFAEVSATELRSDLQSVRTG